MIDTEYLIYVCSNHTHIIDNSWLNDMVEAMDKQEADMGGTISPVNKRTQPCSGWCVYSKNR